MELKTYFAKIFSSCVSLTASLRHTKAVTIFFTFTIRSAAVVFFLTASEINHQIIIIHLIRGLKMKCKISSPDLGVNGKAKFIYITVLISLHFTASIYNNSGVRKISLSSGSYAHSFCQTLHIPVVIR